LWPAGSGHIAKPGQLLGSDSGSQTSTGLSRDIFYVPQRPYTALGTLRDQIIYPLTVADAELKARFESQKGVDIQGLEKFFLQESFMLFSAFSTVCVSVIMHRSLIPTDK
jgi:ABC-type uncharacterized transport system fused permease/ATPase subunit